MSIVVREKWDQQTLLRPRPYMQIWLVRFCHSNKLRAPECLLWEGNQGENLFAASRTWWLPSSIGFKLRSIHCGSFVVTAVYSGILISCQWSHFSSSITPITRSRHEQWSYILLLAGYKPQGIMPKRTKISSRNNANTGQHKWILFVDVQDAFIFNTFLSKSELIGWPDLFLVTGMVNSFF